jgi:Fic-DOC domain mobile mystery protein B
MGLDLTYIEGQTPINDDEKDGLLIKTISTRSELDEFEQYNIEKAVEWSLRNNFSLNKILQVKFILDVHRRMFNEVWEWAGKFRDSSKNIGVDKTQIASELKKLIDDCQYWIDKRSFIEDEIAIRFKHRMVSIHLFPNGNGRHSRLCADILVSHGFGKSPFTWQGSNLYGIEKSRSLYLKALKQADKGNYIPLINFSRF